MSTSSIDEPTARLSPTTRVETFSDGVMAIAITLLIIEVRLPETGGEHGLLEQLGSIWPSYLAYLGSFTAIGVIWMSHHAFFSRLRHLDPALRWANLTLLLAVAFIPFPTAVLAEHITEGGTNARAAASLYGLVGMLQSVAWLLMWTALRRRPEMLEPGHDIAYLRVQTRFAWIGISVFGVSGLLAWLSPWLALTLYGAAIAGYAITTEGWRTSPRKRPAEATE